MRLGMERITIWSGRDVGRLASLGVLVAGLLGLALLSHAASALAAPEGPRWRSIEPVELLGAETGEPAGTETSEPAVAIEAAERKALLAAVNRRHGLPQGVPVPSWAFQSGQHPYFAPSPSALKTRNAKSESARETNVTPDDGGDDGGSEEHEGLGGPSRESHHESGREDLEDLGLRGGHVPPMRYNAGPVELEPKVHVIFWGSNWKKNRAPHYANSS